MAQKALKIVTSEGGVEMIHVDVTITAGAAAASSAITFERPFAAVPRVIGVVRSDANANDVGQGSARVVSLTATGFSLQLIGTSTVSQTYFVTFIGNYNNTTAY